MMSIKQAWSQAMPGAAAEVGLLRELRPSFVRSEPRKTNDHATASRGGSNTIVSETSRENDDNYDDVDEGGGTAGEQAMQGRQQLLENTKATPMKTTTKGAVV